MAAAVSAVAAMSVLYAFGLPLLFDATLGLPLAGRLALSVVLLAPLGMAMGVPFPRAIRMLGDQAAGARPLGLGRQRLGVRRKRDPGHNTRALVRLHLGDTGRRSGIHGSRLSRPECGSARVAVQFALSPKVVMASAERSRCPC